MTDTVQFLPSQIGGTAESPARYTEDPRTLLWSDVRSLIRNAKYIPFGIVPIRIGTSDPYDELYLSAINIKTIVIHTIMIIGQSLFLVLLPFLVFSPFLFAYLSGFWLANGTLCRILNGSSIRLHSKVPVRNRTKYESESWIYLNGVSVGRDWLQSNIDRLSLTFGRPITGVHNPTYGIIFDLIQCLVQRVLCYATQDVRDAYKLVKEALLEEKCEKVVFVLHSQGGIEGGLIIDWLLAELPHDVMHRLEVYTFGNAANHFNNPYKTGGTNRAANRSGHSEPDSKSIRYIEHYANSGDFVSRFGVLHYAHQPNAFMGRVFVYPNNGHLLNQHYLHDMFPLDKEHNRALDTSPFMEMEMDLSSSDEQDVAREGLESSFLCSSGLAEGVDTLVTDVNSPISPVIHRSSTSSDSNGQMERRWKVKDFSRLWQYRNGASPPDTRR